MSFIGTVRKGFQASVTLDNINLSSYEAESQTRTGPGLIELVNLQKSSYEKIYRTQIWVAVVVNKLSRGIGRLPLKTYISGDEAGERERARAGPLPDLLAKPYPQGSPFGFKGAIVGNVGIYGNCVVVKVRPRVGDPPMELIPSSFAYWTLVPGEGPLGRGRPIDWYVFTSNTGQRIPFRPEEVVHFKWWGAGLDIIGAPPLEPLRRTLVIEDAAQRTQIASYEHGARPSGAWSTDAFLNEEQMNTLRKELDDTYGGVDNAFKMAIMSGGVKWLPMSHNMVDSEIVNTRKLTREEVAAAYDMPPPAIEILDRATFSNITEQGIQLYRDTFGPWLTMIEETLQTQLIDTEPKMRGQYVEFDLNEVLKGDIQKRYDAYSKATFMTPNEKRARENLPPKDDPLADALWMPPGSIPIGEGVDQTPFVQPSKGAEAGAAPLMEEARCPHILGNGKPCNKLLAKNVMGAELWCDRCKLALKVIDGQMWLDAPGEPPP